MAGTAEVIMHEKRRAMLSHVDFSNQLLSFPKAPPAPGIAALQKAITILEPMIGALKV